MEQAAPSPPTLCFVLLCQSSGSLGEPLCGVSSLQDIELVHHAPQHDADRRAAQNFVVEARSLTRLACENLICAGALAERGTGFVNDLVLDEAASRKRKGKLLLEHAENQDLGDVTDKLRGYLTELDQKHPKVKGLNIRQEAEASAVRQA